MIQEADDRRIERLKRRLGIEHKVDVLRAGMDLLEAQATRDERALKWAALQTFYFLNSAGQLTTTVMGAAAPSSSTVLTRNRWPSGETS